MTKQKICGVNAEQVELLKKFYTMHTGRDPLEIASLSGLVGKSPELKRIDDLIKLGLWAESHGIPALKIATEIADRLQSLGEIHKGLRKIECDKDDYDPWFIRDVTHLALAALPKGDQ